MAAAVELGHDTLALTDHNRVSGSMEFAEAAAALGLRAIHGAEVDVVEPDRAPGVRNHEVGRHLTLLVEDGEGWRNLCRILTRAHAHTRDGSSARRIEVPPAVPLEFVEEHAAGLVCLSGCATRGVHDEPALRRLLAAFGRDDLRVELQRPFQRDDRARNRAAGRAGGAARGAVRGDRQRPRARARARAAAGRVRGPAPPHDARRVGAAAARQLRPRAGLAGGDGRALRGPSRGGGRVARAGRAADVRPEGRTLGTATRARRTRRPIARLAELCWPPGSRSATRRATAAGPGARRGSRRSCA